MNIVTRALWPASLGLVATPAVAQSNADLAAATPIAERGVPAGPSVLPADTLLLSGAVTYSERIFAEPMGYRPLKLDIYRPSSPKAAQRPLLIWVRGGSWIAGTPRQAAHYADWPGVLARLAAKGYVVASLSYRLAREAPFPVPLQDVKAGIRWLRTNAGDFGIDPTKVGIWGESAGGNLIGLAATTCGVAQFEPVIEPRGNASPAAPSGPLASDCVQAAVGWFGIYDLNDEGPVKFPPRPPEDPTRLFIGCTDAQCTAAQKAWVSPITYVDAMDPPMLLIHGDADIAVRYQQSEVMAAKLKSVGVPAGLLIIPGASHGWAAKTPEATAAAHRQALTATIDYFDKILGPRP